MRGDDQICGSLFSDMDLETRVRADHPLRPLREIANAALAALSRELAALYSGMGRPSIAPEELVVRPARLNVIKIRCCKADGRWACLCRHLI